MRVVLATPGDWPVTETAGGWSYQAADGIRLFASRLIPRPPIFTTEWAERRLADALPEGRQLIVCDRDERTGARGWPMILFRGEVCDDDGAVLEHRLIAAYRFLYFFGTAELRSERPLQTSGALLELLEAASPDFSGEVTCLADIFGSA